MIETGIKMRVLPEQSKEVQKICFDNGIYWINGSKNLKLDSHYIFIRNTITKSNDDEIFIESPLKEIDAESFIKANGGCIYNEVIKKKFMKLINKRNKANKKLRKFAKKYGLEDLI